MPRRPRFVVNWFPSWVRLCRRWIGHWGRPRFDLPPRLKLNYLERREQAGETLAALAIPLAGAGLAYAAYAMAAEYRSEPPSEGISVDPSWASAEVSIAPPTIVQPQYFVNYFDVHTFVPEMIESPDIVPLNDIAGEAVDPIPLEPPKDGMGDEPSQPKPDESLGIPGYQSAAPASSPAIDPLTQNPPINRASPPPAWNATPSSPPPVVTPSEPTVPPGFSLDHSHDRPAPGASDERATKTSEVPIVRSLQFEANMGQSDSSVRFQAHGPGYDLFLTNDEAVMTLTETARKSDETGEYVADAVRFKMVGASPNVEIFGEGQKLATTNYFPSRDPGTWVTDVPNYSSVMYRGLWDGIDARYYGTAERNVEYDFIVQPGAELSQIEIEVGGASNIQVDADGGLLVQTANGELRQQAPVIYQEIDGARSPVAGQFVLTGENRFGFRVESYDRSKPLVIDPIYTYIFGYSTHLAGSSDDYGESIATDTAGNAYVTGRTVSSAFPTRDAYQSVLRGWDAFLSKFDKSGTDLLFSTYFGGTTTTLLDYGVAVATDKEGKTFLSGYTLSTDLPTATSVYQPGFTAGSNAPEVFLVKFAASGSSIDFCTYLGGSDTDQVFGLAVTDDGEAIVVGDTTSSNFDLQSAHQSTYAGSTDAFVTRFNNTGTGLVYSTYLGGTGTDSAMDVAMLDDFAIVVGTTTSTDLGAGGWSTGYGGGASDGFAGEFDSDGTLLDLTYIGGSGQDVANGVAVDRSGSGTEVYVGGTTGTNNLSMSSGAYQTAYGGGASDGYLMRFSDFDSAPTYATYFGGSSGDSIVTVGVDRQRRAVVAGNWSSGSFPTGYGALITGSGEYVARFSSDAKALSFATILSSSGTNTVQDLVVDSEGTITLTGFTTGSTFSQYTTLYPWMGVQSGKDAFITKLIEIPVAFVLSPECNTGCPNMPGSLVAGSTGAASGPDPRSIAPIRYADGVMRYSETDFMVEGFGFPWGITRSWTNGPIYDLHSPPASNWTITQLPAIFVTSAQSYSFANPYTTPTILSLAVVVNGDTGHYFDWDSGTQKFVPRFYDQSTLTHNSSTNEYTLTDMNGNKTKFYDFKFSTTNAARQGRFKSFTDAAGNSISVTSWTSQNKVQELQRSSGGVTESYLFAYDSSGVTKDELVSVTLRRDSGSGWTTIRKVEYEYGDGIKKGGPLGALVSATVKDGDNAPISESYYRYYEKDEETGYAGALKYVFQGPAQARLEAEVGEEYEEADDEEIDEYATYYFEYDMANRVSKEVAQGLGCSSCTGGLGEFTFSYTSSSNSPGFNTWAQKTIETLPDGNQNIVYTNAYGQIIVRAFKETATGNQWIEYFRYDSQGRLIYAANPSVVSGYSESYTDLMNFGSNSTYLADSAGLITQWTYASSTTATSSTPGNAKGFLSSASIQRGETGSAVSQYAAQYYSRSDGTTTIFKPANETVYRNTDGTGGQTTSYAYTWQGSTFAAESIAVTLPTVTTSQNGPNSADVTTVYFDGQRRPTWTKDADGFITYTAYDNVTGGVTKTIVDVDTTQTSDFSNKPSGWTTPAGGGQHLKAAFEVDHMGRVTKATDPNGNITYAIYDDPIRETRIYPGWDSGAMTGPTIVSRDDWALGYSETYTMSATPDTSSGKPTGGESPSGLQTMTREIRNIANQVIGVDQYHNLSGVSYSSSSTTLGAVNTNYYHIELSYDDLGRAKKTVTPTGTIYRTVRDAPGRVASEWVGTDDTPTSGFWSPTNTAGTDLVKVREYEYDGGGIGDSNLTKITEIPGGSDANRVFQMWYDWRDRVVVVKAGVEASEGTSVNRPLEYYTYDNLDEVTRVDRYDGDAVSVTTTNGVPDAPSSSLLRARSDFAFDEQGRVYQTQVFSVDSSGNVSSTALTSNLWYDHRGQAIKSSSPGGLVMKYQYDGAGRVTKSFTSDGGGDSGWSDADDVTGDKVLEQVEAAYDSNGNVILTTVRQRFHDETATGALVDAGTSPKARVSFAAAWYDKANRPTATANVGTNGGSSYTRPGTAPSRSDTVLVTDYGYNAAGWVETITDPKAIVGKVYYDNLGRTTKTIENYVNGTPSNADDKTTEFTYDGSGHLLTLKASLASGYEETKWVYGTSAGAGDSITSNDVLKETRWPDTSSGAASSSEKDVRTFNALGGVRTVTDRNGNVHALSYDVLGRLTTDAVTTLGSGVDGAVRRLEIGYDTQGNAYLFTSYDAASGGNVVNQVQREFNGLGQMTKEYQEHGGAVSTGSSAKVQYAYTEMASSANHSRLTKMTYPSGKELNFNYASGLNDSISRLSSLSDSTGTLESYDFLGLGTVVRRAHSQIGIDLTYIKQSGESNGDAGDQYTGLDRFGRVVDQRWIKTSNGTHTDRFQYGYDRNSNRLWRDNLVNTAFGELYSYDGLNQLSTFDRGTLNGTKTGLTGSASRSQSWSFDALGNWSSVTTGGSTETRSHNKQNEIMSISGLTTPTYDSNGNLTKDETGRTFEYDAWNRLVRAKNSGGTTIAEYEYDALYRRVSETKSGTTTDFYYSANWQVLEERVSGAAKVQYVWSPVYVDALILRDRDATGDSALEERLWVQQDANFNVTALLDNSGVVVERYAYDPYGNLTVYDASWSVRSGGSSYAWVHLHQGGRWEAVTGLYHFRFRDYSPSLGRWAEMDPIGYAAADSNLYGYVGNGTSNILDPSGLSGAGAHHGYPVMLGGSDAGQPLFDLADNQHNAAEKVFEKHGFHNHGNLKANDLARERWKNLTDPQRRAIIIESLQAANVPDCVIRDNIEKIMAGSNAGFDTPSYKRIGRPRSDRIITRKMMDEADRAARLAVEKALKEAAEKAANSSGLKRAGKRIGKMIPFVGAGITVLCWGDDVQAKGLVPGTANSLLDAVPGLGLIKAGTEAATGRDLIPDKGKPGLIDGGTWTKKRLGLPLMENRFEGGKQ